MKFVAYSISMIMRGVYCLLMTYVLAGLNTVLSRDNVGCVSYEEAGITFQFHFLGSSPNSFERNEKPVHPRLVDIFLENNASRNSEAIEEKYLYGKTESVIATSDHKGKFCWYISLCLGP